MARKPTKPASDKKLRQRIAKLTARGVDPSLDLERTTVSEVLDLVGDLTLREIERLAAIARDDNGARILTQIDPGWTPNLTRDRQSSKQSHLHLLDDDADE